MEVRKKGLEPLRVFYIPKWIYKALILNKLNVDEFRDYDKVRKALTLHDMAEWVGFQKCEPNNLDRATRILSTGESKYLWFRTKTQDENLELTNSVLPWSESEEIAASIFNRLSQSNSMTDNSYQFVPSGKTMYVVIPEGFQDITKDNKLYKEFLSDYLKACYEIASLQEVSEQLIMREYIKSLKLG